MLFVHVLSMSRSNSFSVIPHTNACITHSDKNTDKNAVACLKMGPVATAVVLFVVEKAMSRALKGQILRKGVLRKMRRLSHMVLEWNVVLSILYDILEDVFPYWVCKSLA